MIERHSAIAVLLAQASEAHQMAHPTVTISERRPLTILQVSAFGSTQQETAAALSFGPFFGAGGFHPKNGS